MAAPLSPDVSFVDDNLPAIDATTLNNLQQYLYSGLYSAQSSIKALTIDGVGGNVITPNAAQLIVGPMPSLADYPLTIWKDKAGNIRGIVDHLGLKRGRVWEYYEDWLSIGSATLSGANNNTAGRLTWNIPASASAQLGNTGGNPILTVSGTNVANATTTRFYSSGGIGNTSSFASLVMEFEIAATASNVDLKAGLWQSPTITAVTGTPDNTKSEFAICKQSADTNWQFLTNINPGPVTKVDTGVAASSLARVTLEYHGASSPYGAGTVRCFVNGSLVSSTTSNVGSFTAPSFYLAATTLNATNSLSLSISPVRVLSPRFASIDTI